MNSTTTIQVEIDCLSPYSSHCPYKGLFVAQLFQTLQDDLMTQLGFQQTSNSVTVTMFVVRG